MPIMETESVVKKGFTEFRGTTKNKVLPFNGRTGVVNESDYRYEPFMVMCEACFGVVPTDYQDLHDAWHLRMSKT